MAFWRLSNLPLLGLLPFTIFLLHPITTSATVIASTHINIRKLPVNPPAFREAPIFRNGDTCNSSDPATHINIVMTLDANYLRGSMAAILSILQHATCPENIFFHFIATHVHVDIVSPLRSTFPYLNFRVYRFDTSRVRFKISTSIRHALDQPLNYARIYLADMIPADVHRIIYLDSDLIVVDDIGKLWHVELEGKVVGAPEYCHANFSKYFTDSFWFDPVLAGNFEGRKPCYFNTGVMVIDVGKWREGHYRKKIEDWMDVQKKNRIYQLGSLPPFLLVFAGDIKAVDHRWNQHGLGGDNLEGKCRDLHPGPISLLHWSGKGKPWLRLDSRKSCAVDTLWAPYDLFKSSSLYLEE